MDVVSVDQMSRYGSRSLRSYSNSNRPKVAPKIVQNEPDFRSSNRTPSIQNHETGLSWDINVMYQDKEANACGLNRSKHKILCHMLRHTGSLSSMTC